MGSLPLWEAGLRLLAAVALGAAMGFEREARDKPAGSRTHGLVALGAALFTLAGQEVFSDDGAGRIAAQVVSGIGFIGAGAIIRTGLSVRGLTTAATLWVAAAIGLACGAGYIAGGAMGTLAVLFVLVVLRVVDRHAVRRLRRTVVVQYEQGHGTLGPLLRALEKGGVRVADLHIDDTTDELRERPVRHATVVVEASDEDDLGVILDALRQRPEVELVRLDPAG